MTHQMRHPPTLAEDHATLLALRRAIADRIEADIALLDALDGDDGPDAEPNGDDEHPLGWPANVWQLNLGRNTDDGDFSALERAGAGFIRTGHDDNEVDLDLTESDGDVDAEMTAIESAGEGFDFGTQYPDDSEDDDPGGSDTGPSDNGIADDGGAAEQYGNVVIGAFAVHCGAPSLERQYDRLMGIPPRPCSLIQTVCGA